MTTLEMMEQAIWMLEDMMPSTRAKEIVASPGGYSEIMDMFEDSQTVKSDHPCGLPIVVNRFLPEGSAFLHNEEFNPATGKWEMRLVLLIPPTPEPDGPSA